MSVLSSTSHEPATRTEGHSTRIAVVWVSLEPALTPTGQRETPEQDSVLHLSTICSRETNLLSLTKRNKLIKEKLFPCGTKEKHRASCMLGKHTLSELKTLYM